MSTEQPNRIKEKIVNWICDVTPRCHDMTRLLSQAMDERLPWRTRAKMQLHFVICSWCKRYGQQLHLLQLSARQFSEKAPLVCAVMPPDCKARILQALPK